MSEEKLNKTQDIIETPVDEIELNAEEEKEIFILADTLPELEDEDDNANDALSGSDSNQTDDNEE